MPETETDTNTETDTATESRTLPARSEVDPKDCWDLSSLYVAEEDWERDFQKEEANLPQLSEFKGKLAEGPEVLRAYLDLDVESDRRLSHLYNYAARKSDEDTANSHYVGLKDRISSLHTRKCEATAFFRTELVSLPDDTLDTYLEDEALAPFRFVVEKLLREKPYTLSEGEERVLALAGDVTKSPYEIFGQLNHADMKFGFVTDEDGTRVEVTHGSYRSFLSKRNRDVRKSFFETYYQGFLDHKHTLAAALAAVIRRNLFYVKSRGFESARAKALFGNNIPESVYDNLVAAVHKHLPTLHRYYALRKRVLDIEEIHFYDIMVPVVPEIDVRHTYEEAVDKVIAALAPLGSQYCDTLKQGLTTGWVDRYENRGKRSGAYSSGSYDSDPYILLNYNEDNLDDVYTLAHEAGHSMHTWYSSRNRPPQYADYSIFLAEVASTFNEALLTQHLLKTTDDRQMRAYLINREIDDIRGTLFRQVMFAEFEHLLHRRVEERKPLSLDHLTGSYHEILEAYYGPDFTLDSQLDLECLRIPHFYYNFYVYQYATGISAAIALSEQVLGGGPDELSAYQAFLSAGGSAYAIEVLKQAGVDMTGPEPVEAALEHFGHRVDELASLLAPA
ncbi:oligoendopeptidase F [Planctomycetota bacterium]